MTSDVRSRPSRRTAADSRHHRGTARRLAPVEPPAPGQRASRRSAARSFGVPALLLASDVGAFSAAVALTAAPTIKTLLLLLLLLALFCAGDLYRLRVSLQVLDDAASIIGRALAGGAAAMVLGGLDDGVAGIARLRTSATFGLLAVAGRAVVYAAIRIARRHHHLQQRTLLLGAGTFAGSLAADMVAHPEYGLRPVGMLDDDPLLTESQRPVPVVGRYADLTRVLLERRIDVVVVTFGSIRDPSVVDMIRACDRLRCEIYFIPRLYELHTVTRGTEVLWGTPMLRLR